MGFTSVEDVFEKMPQVFNAAAAAGLNLIYQFSISGAQAGEWNVSIQDGACAVSKGVHAGPSVTLSMVDVDWLAMCNGQLNGMTAFMTGKLRASGDIMAAQRIPSLFPMS
jgi:putative sterol carrier protein